MSVTLMLRPSAIRMRMADTLGRGRHLHVQVGLGDRSCRSRPRRLVPSRVAGQLGRHLDRHVAVDPAALVVDRAQDPSASSMSSVTIVQ